ncbi:MAG: aminotransferase class V-fold PLP-dependent enzyme [Bradymonadia bacterium]
MPLPTPQSPPWPRPEGDARFGDRSLFADLGETVYFNHAAISPPSSVVQAAVLAGLKDYATHGAGAFGASFATRGRLKAELATLLGAEAEALALTSGTTAGVQAIAFSLPWTPGDEIVVFDGEFPTNVTTWQQVAGRFDLKVHMLSLDPFAEASGPDLGQLEATLASGRVKLVAVSAVQFQTGLSMPLEAMTALCHRYGAAIFVDVIQGAGVVPLELSRWGVDYLAGGSHKWLMGPEGAGYLYVRPDRLPELETVMAGWLSHTNPLGFLLDGPGHLQYDRPIRQSVDLFEGGSAAAVLFAALDGAVGLINQLGVSAIFDHVQRCHDVLEAGLSPMGFASLRAPDRARRSGNLCLLPPEGVDGVQLVKALDARGLSCALPDGRLRLSPHWPNDTAQCHRAVEIVGDALTEVTAASR